MRRKPWPVILLALLYLCFPFFNILVLYLRLDMSFSNLIQSLFLFAPNRLTLFNTFVPAWIAAFAVFRVRKWSFPVVTVCILWVSGCMIVRNSAAPDFLSILLTIILPVLINFVLALSILRPNIYAFYKDEMLRWWEREDRYYYSYPAEVKIGEQTIRAKFLNISSGGCALESDQEIPDKENLILKTDSMVGVLTLNGRITFHVKNNKWVYGIQFVDVNPELKKNLKVLMKKLQGAKTQIVNPPPEWKEDFKHWLKRAIRVHQER